MNETNMVVRLAKSVWCRLWYGRSYREEKAVIREAEQRSESVSERSEIAENDKTGKKRVELRQTEVVDAERVQEWIQANALPGDTVMVTDPETGDETIHYVNEDDVTK